MTELFALADAHSELAWQVDPNTREVRLMARCDDLFWWGTSDLEGITPADLSELERAFTDVPDYHFIELYAARRRKMRPQAAAYKNIAEQYRPIFDACGSAREARLGNPHEAAAEENKP